MFVCDYEYKYHVHLRKMSQVSESELGLSTVDMVEHLFRELRVQLDAALNDLEEGIDSRLRLMRRVCQLMDIDPKIMLPAKQVFKLRPPKE